MSDAWIERQLVDIVGLDKGVTYASSDYSDVNEGLPFFTIKCVQKGGGFNWSGVKFYSGPFLPNQALKCGDILLALTDLTRAGDIIGSPIAVPNFPGADTILASMDLCKLRPITDQIDTTFLYYRLMLADVRAFMLAHSAGSTVLHLEKKSLPSLKFHFPPLLQQQTIAKIITTVDNLIENTHSLIVKYNAIKQGMMQDLFTRGVDENGGLRPPYDQAPDQYKTINGILIPCKWEISGLSEKARPDRPYLKTGPFGSSLKGEHWVEEGVPVITIGALGEGFIIESELLKIKCDYASLLHEYSTAVGDIVFSRVADVGRSVVITKKEVGWIISSNLMRISLDNRKADPYFTYLCFAFQEQLRAQIRQSVNSSGREIANSDVLNRLYLSWPPIEEQKRIGRIAQSLDDIIKSERLNVRKLQIIKSGLMQDLLTGKVRVNVDGPTESTKNVGVHQS